ncbi:MAG: cytochrome c3 family protein [candidate division Zixibacteria bacterium]|nr:cytochrome c3 family protein [candidate division Zixibacteria bacterium]
MKIDHSRGPAGIPVWVGIVLLLLISGLAQGNDLISDETCLDCHDTMQESLKNTPHQLSSLQKNTSTEIACINCHSGAEIHVEDPEVGNISNPARLEGFEARQACSNCHKPHVGMDNYGFDVHSELELNCSNCHKVHGGHSGLLLSKKAEFCLKCHEEMKNPFSRRSMHPVNQQTITCLSCHSMTKRKDMSTGFEFERVCQDCHPQQAGPFPFEHEAANAYAVEGNGCLSCHDPHGSENDKLLKQSGEELCSSCHMTPPGHLNLPALHGPIRDIENCVACHSAVHGSFTSHKLLDPFLQSRLGSPQDCNQCHDLSD